MKFFVSGFFVIQLVLVLIDTIRSNLGVYIIFVELLIFESDSPVYPPPGSRSEGLKRSKFLNHGPLANGWIFNDCSFKVHGKLLNNSKM
jgi:hypothetical protein